jgi:hypothetical protein
MKFSFWIDDLRYEELCYPLWCLEATTILLNEFNVIVLPRYNKKMYQQKLKCICKNKWRQQSIYKWTYTYISKWLQSKAEHVDANEEATWVARRLLFDVVYSMVFKHLTFAWLVSSIHLNDKCVKSPKQKHYIRTLMQNYHATRKR